MIIRIQSPDGMRKVEVDAKDTSAFMMNKIQKIFGLDNFGCFNLFKGRGKKDQILALERKTVHDYGLNHADIVYLEFVEAGNSSSTINPAAAHSTNGKSALVSPTPTTSASVQEDEVDKILWKQSGLIERPRDEQLCKHGPNGKCLHCTPIEPYDEAYLKEHNIKHMSFHAYLRKMTRGIDKGKFAFLENISCKIKPGCKTHLPWPAGICTKCQPSAVTLNRQVYRHVDNLVFENATIVERFLNYWRTTGNQRIGFLYGYYEPHHDVPLGIKATVVGIYEPPQESTRDMVRLDIPDRNEDLVESIAAQLGLRRVGWIFTDLLPDDFQKGTVKHLRNVETHFLSAQECIMAGYLQNSLPNPCRLSPERYFGSKSVTVCVTGDKENQVHMEGYQVSNQCMALVNDNCLIPTKDAPELGYVRETSKEQYVPDVFFKEKDSFGNDATKIARPLPIEYLLVDVPASTPVEPKNTFNPLPDKNPFPIENRMLDGQIQDFASLTAYLSQFSKDTFYEAASDFHFLLYVANMDMLPLKDALGPLLKALKEKDRNEALLWTERCEQWATLEELISIHQPAPSVASAPSNASASGPSAVDQPGGPPPPQPPVAKWSCSFCTFENSFTNGTCEMCGLPKTVTLD